ncbi:MAG: hypothetical protein K2H82_03605 [Oscillospiraceae bacterium]|nr:hypothetical protein [Oscillospiraceae bacterium]
MREAIITLTNQIQTELQKISDFIHEGREYNSDLFDIAGSFSAVLSVDQIKMRTEQLKGRKGVYLFVSNSSFEISTNQILEWNKVTSALINSHDAYGNNINADISQGQVFYLGSCYSEKGSLLTRLRQHCNYAKDKPSLKLQNERREWIRQYLEVYFFAMERNYSDEEKRIILPAIEHRLHISFKPIAGSKRT